MKQISNFTLKWRNKYSQRYAEKPQRKTLNFVDTKDIGILAYLSEDKDYQVLDNLIKKLQAEGKNVKILVYHAQPADIVNSLKYSFFTPDDLTVTGKIKSEEATDFINTKFDYLYCLNNISSEVTDYIMLRSKALCRIGKYFPEKKYCFELMIHTTGESLEELSQQLLHFTSIISKNEK
jgi:hypothetical protein